jgi:hypothetical protein
MTELITVLGANMTPVQFARDLSQKIPFLTAFIPIKAFHINHYMTNDGKHSSIFQ